MVKKRDEGKRRGARTKDKGKTKKENYLPPARRKSRNILTCLVIIVLQGFTFFIIDIY
jgi:hypothetical protein